MRASDDVVDRVALAEHLAASVREAGALALTRFDKAVPHWTKADGSPVTEADMAVDRLLRRRLGEALPGCAWLSEESHDDQSRLAARLVWVVDPIDGTRAFMGGRPDWSIAVALVEDGRPVIAAVLAPVEQSLFLAGAGAGATLNGAVIRATAGQHACGHPRGRPQTHPRRGGTRGARRGSEPQDIFAGAPPRPGRARHARCGLWRRSSTAGHAGKTRQTVQITHPFHPLCGRKFELICRRRHWGEDRVVYEGQNGRFCTIASAWTDIDPADEFRLVAEGRAAFCAVDLLALCDALDRLVESIGAGDA